MKNAQAYYGKELNMVGKSFIVQATRIIKDLQIVFNFRLGRLGTEQGFYV
jgi:hypothetical protein